MIAEKMSSLTATKKRENGCQIEMIETIVMACTPLAPTCTLIGLALMKLNELLTLN